MRAIRKRWLLAAAGAVVAAAVGPQVAGGSSGQALAGRGDGGPDLRGRRPFHLPDDVFAGHWRAASRDWG